MTGIERKHSLGIASEAAFSPRRGTLTKMIFGLALALALLAPSQAKAEGGNGVYDWIMNMGNMSFSQGGGVFLPTGVLNAMRYGQISPIMQFVTVSHMMNSCIANAVRPEVKPLQRDPFLVAQKKFTYGLCLIKKCWQNAVTFSTLSTLAANNSNGGADNQIAMVLAQSFQKDPACDGGQGGGIDPNLIALITGGSGGN